MRLESHNPPFQMEAPANFAGLRVLVMGLGRFGGGVGVTQWLAAQGAVVTVSDQADRSSLSKSLDLLSGFDVTFHLGGHDPGDLDGVDWVVVNPAVHKARSTFFQEIVRRNVPWTTETNLFCRNCRGRIVGVTGSYGKSTTCAMLADALRAGLRAGAVDYTGVHLGGNIGRSLLNDLPGIGSEDLVVLELSNAQLEDLPRIGWAPPIAVITNLWPHHRNRYDGFAAYVDAKLNIVRDPSDDNILIVGDLARKAESMLRVTLGDRFGRLLRVEAPSSPVQLKVPGAHNQANAACVLTICRHLGLDREIVREALRSFAGLPHRIEYVRTIEGVDYYNDSKSTSPDATIAALKSFDRPVVAILGGQQQSEAPWTTLAEVLVGSCQAVICTGQSGGWLARMIRKQIGDSDEPRHRVSIHETGTPADAVRIARSCSRPGDVVLFSPGAPSFDAFANYADRGDHFVKLIQALADADSVVASNQRKRL